jgi:RNA polymerase subunit RPABC4/transcription elongation factor Spt4
MILCVIIGQDIKEICKQAGIKVAHRFTYVAIKKLPVEILKKINQTVGFRLVTKAGEKGIVNLTKLVPFVGGVVGGTVDAITCRITAKAAKNMFVALENNQDEELESIDITPLEEPQTVSEIKCENCGLGLSKNSKFCQFCGEKHIPKQQLVINCPKCGKNVSNSKFCSECGYKLEQPVCSKCGTKLTNNEKFCPECGQKSN